MTATRRLPRGRHGLSREQVAQDQRRRMLFAMAEAMTVDGYVGTSVADVIKRAGVSRETFYQQFSSKQECFLSAFDAAGEFLLDGMAEVAAEGSTPMDRFERALNAYLDGLAEHPAYARLFLVEVNAAGVEAMQRRAALQERIVDAMVALLELDRPEDRFTCSLIVAGVGALVTVPLVNGDLVALGALRAPILQDVRRRFSS